MWNVFGWIAVCIGALVIVLLPAMAVLVAHSHFRYVLSRSPALRRDGLFPLWRIVPIWLFLAFSVAKFAYDLLPNTGRDPAWVLPVSCLLTGMVVWASVENLLTTLKQRSEKESAKEAYRRDMA